MSRILVLANSGFGKTFSIGKVEELNHIGLDSKETFIISVTTKPLTFPGAQKDYPVTTLDKISVSRRIISNNPEIIAKTLTALATSPFKNIILDDFNYVMQDYYMSHALAQGWDCPKKIGYFMGEIFKAIELFNGYDKHIFVLAHSEAVLQTDNRTYYKLKTTGKMTDEYITPEGKFDITLIGKSKYDTANKKVIKEFITNEDEFVSSAKSPYGMFPELYIPNDLGQVLLHIEEYYKK